MFGMRARGLFLLAPLSMLMPALALGHETGHTCVRVYCGSSGREPPPVPAPPPPVPEVQPEIPDDEPAAALEPRAPIQTQVLRRRRSRRFSIYVGGGVVAGKYGSGATFTSALRLRLSRWLGAAAYIERFWRPDRTERWSTTGLLTVHLPRLLWFRPYFAVGGGIEFGDNYDNKTNDLAGAWMLGGGLELPLGPLSLVIDVRARFIEDEAAMITSAGLVMRF